MDMASGQLKVNRKSLDGNKNWGGHRSIDGI